MKANKPKDKLHGQPELNGRISVGKYVMNLLTDQRNTAPFHPLADWAWGFIGCFVGIGIVISIGQFAFHEYNFTFIASLSISACYIFCDSSSAFAQPRNLFVGHIISAIVGITVFQFMGNAWYAAALGFTLAFLVMQLTETVHPPAGATVLIPFVSEQGWLFPVFMGVGVIVLILLGILINRFVLHRSYPNDVA